MSRFSLGLETHNKTQNYNAETYRELLSEEIELQTNSPFSPVASRAFSNAINNSVALEKVNEVLLNTDNIDDIPESSRRVMETAMEGIRCSLLGTKSKESYGLESFKDVSALNIAIEENKGVLARVWEAIVKFFKSIFSFIGRLFGLSSEKSKNNIKNTETIKVLVNNKKQNTDELLDQMEKASDGWEKRKEEILKTSNNISAVNIPDVKIDESASRNILDLLDKTSEAKKDVTDSLNILREVRKILRKNPLVKMTTSKYNSYFNSSFISNNTITVSLDDDISSLDKYFEGIQPHFIKIKNLIIKHLKNFTDFMVKLDKQTAESDLDKVYNELNSLSELKDKELEEAYNGVESFYSDIDKNCKFYLGFLKYGNFDGDEQLNIFVVENKNKNDLCSFDRKSLLGVSKNIQKNNELVKSLTDELQKYEKNIESTIDNIVKDYSSYDELYRDIVSNIRNLIDDYKDLTERMVNPMNRGQKIVDLLNRIIMGISKDKANCDKRIAEFVDKLKNNYKDNKDTYKKLKEEPIIL